MDATGDVDIRVSAFCGVFISNEVNHMFLNCCTCDLNWYNTIVSWQYLKGRFNKAYCCLLFTISCVCKEFSIFLYVTDFSLIPSTGNGEFLLNINSKIISLSDNLLQIMKLWVNVNSAILKCSGITPKAVIGEPSVVFNLAVVGCIGVLKQSSIWPYFQCLSSEIAAPESIRALYHFLAWTVTVGQSMIHATVFVSSVFAPLFMGCTTQRGLHQF